MVNKLMQGAPAVAEAQKKLGKSKGNGVTGTSNSKKQRHPRARIKGAGAAASAGAGAGAGAMGSNVVGGGGGANAATSSADRYGTFIDSEDEEEYECVAYGRSGAYCKKKKTGRFKERVWDKAYVQEKIHKYQEASDE